VTHATAQRMMVRGFHPSRPNGRALHVDRAWSRGARCLVTGHRITPVLHMLKPKTSRLWLLTQVVPLLDDGTIASIEGLKEAIRNRSVDKWLTEISQDDIDLSTLSADDWNDLHDELEPMLGIDEQRKMGIARNGLCLLAMYLLEDLARIVSDRRKKKP